MAFWVSVYSERGGGGGGSEAHAQKDHTGIKINLSNWNLTPLTRGVRPLLIQNYEVIPFYFWRHDVINFLSQEGDSHCLPIFSSVNQSGLILNQSVAWYACKASLWKERYVKLNDWKIRRSVC